MKPLKTILTAHSLITLLAGAVLVVAPQAIPHTVEITISKEQYLLCYFLAAAEIAIAYLSYRAAGMKDPKAVGIIIRTFIIFHLLTATLELYAMTEGASPKLAVNVSIRLIVCIVFFVAAKSRNAAG